MLCILCIIYTLGVKSGPYLFLFLLAGTTQICIKIHFDPIAVGPPPDRQSIVYGDIVTMLSFAANATRRSSSIHASITQTVGETPIVKLQRMAPEGINVFVKCESENPGGSVKDRLALGVIEWAEKEGHLKPGQTVVEASSGNTGIGLAMVCAARGYPLVVVMSESFSIERRKLMRFLGAKVVLTNPGEL